MSTRGHSRTIPPIPLPTDPVVVRLGVTGHRALQNLDRIRKSVHEVLAGLDHRLRGTQHRYHAISPLAEGADRLVAECVLNWKGHSKPGSLLSPKLEIILPMPAEKYFNTFSETARAESIEEFNRFLPYSLPPRVIPTAESDKEAFERVGREVVDSCDILIAIWDGHKARGKGGTAEVIEYAKRSKTCTIFQIEASTGWIRVMPGSKDAVSQIDFLREYNREPLGARPIGWEIEQHIDDLGQKAKISNLDPGILEPLNDGVVAHSRRANRRALHYQKLYFGSTAAAYIVSACAVGTAVIGALFDHDHWQPFMLEAVEIIFVIVLVWPSRYRNWQRKWIDYRYLGERLRASCFLYVAGLKDETSEPPADLQLSWLPDTWVVLAIRELWKTLPARTVPTAEEGAVSRFLFSAWIDHQRKYYAVTSERNSRNDETLERFLRWSIWSTLSIAILHFALPQLCPEIERLHEWILNVLSVFAVTLPAVASALAGISVFRHFNRNAERYHSMSLHLEKIGKAMKAENPPPTAAALQQLVREADRAMAHEHQGWRMVFGVHLPAPG